MTKLLTLNDIGKGFVWSSSRKRIYLDNPRPENFDIEAIARGLSKVCRFNAQCKVFYSVATHSIILSNLCPQKLKLHALLHDASEAYLHDLSKPLKNYLKIPEAYKPIEESFMKAISKKFGFSYNKRDRAKIKKIEQSVVLAEIRDLMDLDPSEVIDYTGACPIYVGKEILPQESETLFLQKYNEIRDIWW